MSRYAAKTYGRTNSQKLCSASSQFDQIFGDQSNKPSTKVSPTFHKWGQTSFKPARSTQVNGQREIPENFDVKRRRVNEALDDPFSFDSDEDLPGSPLKHRIPAKSEITTKPLPYNLPLYPVHSKAKQTSATGVRTYARKTNILSDSSKPVLSLDQKRQTTMDTFVTKQTSETKIKLCRSSAKPGNELISDIQKEKEDIWSLIISGSSSNSPTSSVNPTDSRKESSDSEIEFNLPKLKENLERSISDDDDDDDDDKIIRTFTYEDFKAGKCSDDDESFSDVELVKPFSFEVEDKTKLLNKDDETAKHLLVDDDFDLSKPFSSDDDDEEVKKKMKPPVFSQDYVQPDIIKTYGSKERNLGSPSAEPNIPEKSESNDNSAEKHLPVLPNSIILKKAASDPTPLTSSYSCSTSTTTITTTNSTASTSTSNLPPEKPRRFYSPKKASGRALYKHRTWQDDNESIEPPSAEGIKETSRYDESANIKDRPVEMTRIRIKPIKPPDEIVPFTRSREKKELYTVVRNVKQAHQCHESGETQEMNDDIEYLLEGLQSSNSMGTRCLSVISLATKCMAASFRMHLRAHGTIPKIFSALCDAPSDLSLAICTASVMFILSRDRLNMDLDRASLDLMLQLLEADSGLLPEDINNSASSRDYIKTRQSVCKLCQQLQSKGFVKDLNLDNVSAGYLSMEALLSLTSRKAGEWFKEELRLLGGLDHIIDTVSGFAESLSDNSDNLSDSTLDRLGKVDRCLRVLENVTFMNTDNQAYLLTYKQSSLIAAATRTLQFCENLIPSYPMAEDKTSKEGAGCVLYDCLLDILRVLLNLTHDNDWGSTKVGEQDGLMKTVLICILQVPHNVPADQRFDLLVLGLGLLINLVEHCDVNKSRLISTQYINTYDSFKNVLCMDAIQAVVQLFLLHESAARAADLEDTLPISISQDTTTSGNSSATTVKEDGKDQKQNKEESENKNEDSEEEQSDIEIIVDDVENEIVSSQQDTEETITKALHKAGKHMEDSIVASYVALLLGCVIQNCKDYADLVRKHLPDNSFDVMSKMLRKFLNFMNLTSAVGTTGSKNIATVIDVLEAS